MIISLIQYLYSVLNSKMFYNKIITNYSDWGIFKEIIVKKIKLDININTFRFLYIHTIPDNILVLIKFDINIHTIPDNILVLIKLDCNIHTIPDNILVLNKLECNIHTIPDNILVLIKLECNIHTIPKNL